MASLLRIVRNPIPSLCRGFTIGKPSVSKVTRKFGSLIAQVDASKRGHEGGSAGWIIRNFKNNCLSLRCFWIHGISDTTCLELYGINHLLWSFAGAEVPLQILTDSKAAIDTIHQVKRLLDKGIPPASIIEKKGNKRPEKQKQLEIALRIVNLLRERYQGPTSLKLVNGNDTRLAHHLANFIRVYSEEADDLYEGQTFDGFEVCDPDVMPATKLILLREHSLCTDTYKCTDYASDDNFLYSDDASFPSLGVHTIGGLTEVIIPCNVVGPVKVDRRFSTYFDYQEKVVIQVFEGQRPQAKYNYVWGRVEVDVAPAPKGVAKIAVSFYINTDNHLNVTVRHEGQEFLVCGSRTKLTEDQIDQMFHQAVTYAVEDECWKKGMETKLAWVYKTTKILNILKDEQNKAQGNYKTDITNAIVAITGFLTSYDMTSVNDPDWSMRNVENALNPLNGQVVMERVKDALVW